MTPLRQRMLDAMMQRGFALRTRESYVEAVARMARYYRRDPATLAADEVQAYLLHLRKDRQLSFSTVNQAASANRFLYEVVLGHERYGSRSRTPRRRRSNRRSWRGPNLPHCSPLVSTRSTAHCCKRSMPAGCECRKPVCYA